MTLDTEFHQLAFLLASAVLAGLAGSLLRLPLIVSFIGVGVVVGPDWLDVASGSEQLELLASVGIALLLFVVGLKLDVQVIRRMGRAALAAGLSQVVFTTAIGMALTMLLGFEVAEAIYVAIALTFSSTIVIIKMLSDKGEIDALHGRLAVGILIVQDLAVVLAMIAASALGTGEERDPLREGLLVVAKGAGLLAAVAFCMRFVIPVALPILARSSELLVLGAMAWAVSLSAVGDILGFSKEVGAFLAGVSLASTPYRELIGGRLTSIRDFLLLFFFVQLGADLNFDHATGQIATAGVLAAYVLIGNPLIVIAVLGVMGYRKRTSFLTGMAMGQVSEFSIILAALGVSLGHISDETLGLIALVAVVTIALSSYVILYSHQLYARLGSRLDLFERPIPHPEDEDGELPASCDVILFGLGRFGGAIASRLRARGDRVLGIDFDPEVVARWRREGWPVHYGDAEDPEFVGHLPLASARWVIGATPGSASNLALGHALREAGYIGNVAVTAHTEDEASRLERLRPDVILRPFEDAAVRAVEEIGWPGAAPLLPGT